MSSDSSSTNNTSLTRSLTKVKSRISSKLKISSGSFPDDHYDNDEHVLKAMKYDDIIDTNSSAADMAKSRSNSVIQMDEIKIPKSLSITSIKIPQTLSSSDLQPTTSIMSSKRGSNTSVEIQSNLGESNTSSRSSSIDHLNDSSVLSITTSSINDSSKELHNGHQETLLPPPVETSSSAIRSGGIRMLTPNSELRSPFSTIAEEQPFNVLSPPISPKRHESVCCDPLNKVEVLKEDNATHARFEAQANDFADAMALSILDKVDDSNTSEWKI